MKILKKKIYQISIIKKLSIIIRMNKNDFINKNEKRI